MARELWFAVQTEERAGLNSIYGSDSYEEAVRHCREIRNSGGISNEYPMIHVLDENQMPVPDLQQVKNCKTNASADLVIPFWAQSRFRERDFDIYRN